MPHFGEGMEPGGPGGGGKGEPLDPHAHTKTIDDRATIKTVTDDSATTKSEPIKRALALASQSFPAFEACSPKEKAFVLAYLRENCDSTKAMVASGLAEKHESDNGTRLAGWRLRRSEPVAAAIEEIQLAQVGGSAETLQRFARWSATTIEDVLDEEGNLDLEKARRTGAIHAIKAITTKTWYDKGKGCEVTARTVELHDAKDAAKVLAKNQGLLEDTLRIKGLPSEPDALYQRLAETIARKTGRPLPPPPRRDPN
jgi:hypothetical protein